MKRFPATACVLTLCACETAATDEVRNIAPAPALIERTAMSPCTRGAIDETRSFLLCPEGMATAENVALALEGPADLSLDVRRMAGKFGLPAQALTGIEAATYARIVPNGGKTAPPKRSDAAAESGIEAGGRNFILHKTPNAPDGRVLLIEK